MSFSVNCGVAVSGSDIANLNKSVAKTVDSVESYEVSVAAETDDVLVNCAIDISQLQFLMIHASADVTLETNDSGSPQESIALKANNPLYWSKDAGIAIAALFAGDVSKLYFSNVGAAAATVNIRLGIDSTP